MSFVVATSIVSSVNGQEVDFRALFNGKDFSGWVNSKGYSYQDGAIVSSRKSGTMYTEASYTNYILEFEFKLTPNGNNGIGIHYPGSGNVAHTGMEIQILDDTGKKHQKLKDYQYHGSLYFLQAAKKGFLKPVGEWNHERIEVNGKNVKVTLNGTEILNADLDELAKSHGEHAGVKRRDGHIVLFGHDSEVSFRNMRIKELP